MNDQTIVCPNCKNSIKLTESLAAPMVEAVKRQHEQAMAKKDADIRAREETVRLQQAAFDEQLAARMKDERGKIAVDEAKKARLALNTDIEQKTTQIADLTRIIGELNGKLTKAHTAEVELIKKQQEFETLKQETDLIVAKRIQESLGKERDTARKQAAEEFELKVQEKNHTIEQLARQLDEMKRKAEQGSQQSQGEVQELVLEALLEDSFPDDAIEPVPKGVHGGDVVQRVSDGRGKVCGSILWESKRTKNWSDGWLSKLRDDQRAASADVAIIVTQVLPKHIEFFDLHEGVWITERRYVLPIAVALRQSLIGIACARQANEGRQSKMELVYEYLTGASFRQRVEAIVEKFADMREDLDRERKFLTKQWAKREKQINTVIATTAGMVGDLQGIAGKSIQEIEGLDGKLLDEGAKGDDDELFDEE